MPDLRKTRKDLKIALAAMVAVPGITSAQRLRALDPGVPPSLAMYTVY